METVWDSGWGDYTVFEQWVEQGCEDPAPEEIAAAARFFHGQES